MKPVELAQNGRRRRPRAGLGQSGNENFDARTENVGFLSVERRLGARGEEKNDESEEA
jgi:hypothetical protein